MSNSKTDTSKDQPFEIISSDENSAVFRRVLSRKGRSSKEMKELERNLPTARIHFFDRDDFDRLKAIESTLISEEALTEKQKHIIKIIVKAIIRFLIAR